MSLADKIVEIIEEYGFDYKEKSRTIHTECPLCNRADKFSILKENGAAICYRGSCEFGKRWFEDWIMLTANITRPEAKMRLYGNVSQKRLEEVESNPGSIFDTFKSNQELKPVNDFIEPMMFPEFDMIPLDHPEAQEAVAYLYNRGIQHALAMKHRIHYSPEQRRVILPIVMDGKVYGYQGRAIDPVEPAFRMRNNVGFRREVLVMFADELKDRDYAIICEGPFDALKFFKVGGYVATMGKVVTDKQLATIMSYNPRKIYLALDDDAAAEMRELQEKITSVPLYRIFVPESCEVRCKFLGKKADFGECTFDECKEAFDNAVNMNEGYTPIYLKQETE
jgi:hypothetical protein